MSNLYNELWEKDPRREAAPRSASHNGWDFTPTPPSKPTPLWAVLVVIIGGPAVLFFAGVMLT